ncbi:MAG: leucine-rich repeat protein [Clostridia bacterium]|nr:leucine-rich repeat protein [Clostridia bacterium]
MNMRHCPTCYSNQFIEKPDGLHCAFCDNRYIEPKQRSDRQEMMLEIAYTDLRNMNFIEAESSFEEIIALYPDLHEAYWGCLSSRCGLKYEEDYSGKKIPTCCLPHMQSILEDSYYQKATALADPEIAAQYRDTAEYVERVRQTWIEHASKLPPYDIFISYKESDAEHGISRTQDSINAQELYAHLTRQGYRVFYSHDSLRDVVGEKYEPYIFHALETAKVMIVYGTKPEYINSTWLKNEWMRYMKKIERGDKQKGSLLVVYEGFSPYELPGALRFQGIDGASRSCYADIDDRMRRLIPQVTAKQEEARKAEETRKAEEAKKVTEAQKAEEARKSEEARKAEEVKKALSAAEAHTAELARLREMTAQAEKANQEEAARRQEEARKAEAERLEKARQAEEAEKTAEAKKAEEAKRAEELAAAQKKLWATLSQGASKGLELHRRQDGKFAVTGMGECKDKDIRIPPVTEKGEEIVEIADGAFKQCSELTSVAIPDTIIHIGISAFEGCSTLSSIYIPANVINIGEGAFCGCLNLTSIAVAEQNPIYQSKGNCLIQTPTGALLQGCQGSTIPMDGSIMHICESAFMDCFQLTNLIIPDSVTSIERYAFFGCSGITELVIPDSVTSIGDMAFGYCFNLKNVIVGDNVTNIGVYAFGQCSNLSSITLPSGVDVYTSSSRAYRTSAGHFSNPIFDDCPAYSKYHPQTSPIPSTIDALTHITITRGTGTGNLLLTGSSYHKCGSIFGNLKNLKSVTITDGVTSIGDSCFHDCKNLTTVTLPNTLISIGNSSFAGCRNLINITIPDSVTIIGEKAFSCCENLTNIILPDSIETIEEMAFAGCKKLKNFTFGQNTQKIGCGIFSDPEILEFSSDFRETITIVYPGSKAQFRKIKKFGWKRGAPEITMVYNASPNA